MNYFLAKAIAAAILALISIDRPRTAIERALASIGTAGILAIFAVTRVIPALVAFAVLDLPAPGDAIVFYVPIAQAVLSGDTEISSPYHPGFDYLLAALYSLTGSPLSFGAAFLAAEVAALGCTLAALGRRAPHLRLPVAAFWLVNPLSMVHVTLGGQDESLILLGFSLALWLLASERPVLAGATVALAFLGSKIYGVFAALPLVTAAYRRPRPIVACAATLAAGVGVLLYCRVPLFGVLNEAIFATAGNIWAFPALAFSADGVLQARPWQFAGSALANAATILLVLRRPLANPVEQVLRLAGTVGCVFLVTAPQSYVAYLVMFLPGLLFLLLRLDPWERTILVLALLPTASFESSLWFRVGEGQLFGAIPWSRPAMVATDVVLIGSCLWLAWRGLTMRDRP